MITKDSGIYAELFAEANKCLIDIGINDTIDSIEEYFRHLHDLVYTNRTADPEAAGDKKYKYNKVDNPNEIGEESLKFLRLPLDEPMFEINANTREIQVPRDSWTHGVKGDEIAEVLFFRINRYFDTTDLAQMNIAIEWNNGSEVGSTESFIKYVEEDSKDKDLKIIFGWPLDSKITSNASTVRFSIHFYQAGENTNQYVYSFHTLPQEIHIKDTLKIDYSKVKVENFRDKILGRVSSSTGDKASTATIPYFILPSELNTEINDISNGYSMYAVAGRERGESTTYKWYCGTPGDKDNSEALKRGEQEEATYEPADDYIQTDKFLSRKINGTTVAITTYYYGESDKKEIINCYSQEDFNQAAQEKGSLYVAVSRYNLDSGKSAGQYWVEAYNRYALTHKVSLDDKNNNIPVWTITSPLTPSIEVLPEYFIIGNNNVLTANVSNTQDSGTTYSWSYYADEGQNVEEGKSKELFFIPWAEGYYYLTVNNRRNNDNKYTVSNKVLCLKNYNSNDYALSWKLSYLGFGTNRIKVNCPTFNTNDSDKSNDYFYKTYETIKCEWFESSTPEIGNDAKSIGTPQEFHWDKDAQIIPSFYYQLQSGSDTTPPAYYIAKLTFSKGNIDDLIVIRSLATAEEG